MTNAKGEERTAALRGGNWNNGTNSGAFYWSSQQRNNTVTNMNRNNHTGYMAPRPKYDITRERLVQMHIIERLPPREIAERIGCSHDLVLHYIAKFGIEKLPKYKRIEGERYGRLIVESLETIGSAGAVWRCRCDCGNVVSIPASRLGFGVTRSCGCLAREACIKHGLSDSRPYHIWQGMKTRCGNPKAVNFERYGGRGITYDPRWSDFEEFWKDMEPGYSNGLSIERIDNDGPYCKENCAWVDARAQSLNKSNSVILEMDGERLTITEWSERLNVSRKMLYYWHDQGLSDAEIFDRVKKSVGGRA